MSYGSRRHKGGSRAGHRNQVPSFHIFCEGVNTEPLYFKSFPVTNIGHCKGYALTKTKLVQEALNYKRVQGITKKASIDQLWVVFDYDYNGNLQPQQKEDFNSAITLAIKHNIHCAVSNDAFELWYVLHFQDCSQPQLRNWYNDRLSHHLGIAYDKHRTVANKMYKLLAERQHIAIQQAIKLKALYNESDTAHADKNPFTTVHELVIALNKYLQ